MWFEWGVLLLTIAALIAIVVLLGKVRRGERGRQGRTGTAGANGSKGTAGANGSKGVTGPTGANGVAGTATNTGAQGITGGIGASGAQGFDGDTGPQGTTGPPGEIGPVGATGASTTSIVAYGAPLTGDLTAGIGGTLFLTDYVVGAPTDTTFDQMSWAVPFAGTLHHLQVVMPAATLSTPIEAQMSVTVWISPACGAPFASRNLSAISSVTDVPTTLCFADTIGSVAVNIGDRVAVRINLTGGTTVVANGVSVGLCYTAGQPAGRGFFPEG
jgi:hypothetical protein